MEAEKLAGRIGAHVVTSDVFLAVSMLAAELARTDAAERADVARRAWPLLHAAFAPR